MAIDIKYNAGLVKTKYSIPRANRYLIPRRHLYLKLNNSLTRKLTLVTAPAGYGKTTAVLEWLERDKLPAAWLSVDAEDNNLMVFWRYACAALDGIAAGIIRDAEYVFTSQELLKANIQVNILIDRLAGVESDFLFIIDDLHLISNPLVFKGLSYLINYLPPRMHLVLISRTEPDLELAKLEIKSQLLRLGVKDLRFREEEISRFYKIRGFPLDNKDVEKVENYTGGWAAALVAIAMSIEKDTVSNDIVAGFALCGRSIYQYLKEEVIDSWPLEKKMFALKTSILDTLCEPLCDAVTGDSNGGLMLQDLRDRDEFIISLDDEKHMYKYHHLLKNFLYELLQKSDPAGLLELHARAAGWYREKGLASQAIEHYLSGLRYDEALTLIEPQLSDLAGKNDYDTAIAWIDRLPESYRENSIDIAGFYAVYYAELNRFEQSQEWVARVEQLARDIEPRRKPYAKALFGLISFNLLLRSGRIEELSALITNVREDEFSNYKMMEHFDFNKADIYFYRCPIFKGASLFGERIKLFSELARKTRKVLIKKMGYTPLAAGEYLYENNRLDEAIPYLLEALEEARFANCPGALVPVMVNLARIKRARGDLPGAFAALDECEKELQPINKIHWNYLINAFRTRLYLENDDMDMVDKWIGSSRLSIYSEISRINEFELIVYARVLMAKNCTDDAGLLLARLLSFTENEARPHSKVEILNLLAMLAYKRGELTRAVSYMEESLTIGIKEGFVRSYVDEFEPVINVLKQTVSHLRKEEDPNADLTAYAKKLLRQTQADMRVLLPANSEAAASRLKNTLTAQEIKVLELLYSAHTNEEICSKLNIGLRTVKTHTGNIYSKLGVKNRAQCIKLVRETQLLE